MMFFRVCVRAHKLALTAQRRFWSTLLRDTIAFADLQRSMDVMQKTEKQAQQIYHR